MGNLVTCNLTTPSNRAIRVVFPGGEIRQYTELEVQRAADLMLECPNFFLVNSKSVHIGRRFSALAADEELESGNVYIMFPMKRVNSVVVAADFASVFMSSGKRIQAASDNGQQQQQQQQRLRLLDEGFPIPEFKYRVVSCRSRKPLLETIKEDAVFMR